MWLVKTIHRVTIFIIRDFGSQKPRNGSGGSRYSQYSLRYLSISDNCRSGIKYLQFRKQFSLCTAGMAPFNTVLFSLGNESILSMKYLKVSRKVAKTSKRRPLFFDSWQLHNLVASKWNLSLGKNKLWFNMPYHTHSARALRDDISSTFIVCLRLTAMLK